MFKRKDGRAFDQLRPLTIEKGVNIRSAGSAFVKMGDTHVLCVASVEEKTPAFLAKSGKGWVTAEYSMLPGSTDRRFPRERRGAGGRTMEIQRLIGRSLRSVINPHLLGERTVILDCDVLQADGGTRTASITGAYVALSCAMQTLVDKEVIASNPLISPIAAVSVGLLEVGAALDLDFQEDSDAIVDMNLVMAGSGKIVEIQATGEKEPFSRDEMTKMIWIGQVGLDKIFQIQKKVLET